MRGTGDEVKENLARAGITPACAGNSVRSAVGLAGRWDHPRVCGEQGIFVQGGGGPVGSPPRVRGTGSLCSFRLAPKRITPACAGNSELVGILHE